MKRLTIVTNEPKGYLVRDIGGIFSSITLKGGVGLAIL